MIRRLRAAAISVIAACTTLCLLCPAFAAAPTVHQLPFSAGGQIQNEATWQDPSGNFYVDHVNFGWNPSLNSGLGGAAALGVNGFGGALGGEPVWGASGLSAVTTTISAAGASSPLTPVAGRGGLHWLISGTGVATCAMEQNLGTTQAPLWYPITINGQPFGVISYTGSPVNETSQENGYGIPHRLNCGATNVSGAANGSFTSGSLSVTLVQP